MQARNTKNRDPTRLPARQQIIRPKGGQCENPREEAAWLFDRGGCVQFPCCGARAGKGKGSVEAASGRQNIGTHEAGKAHRCGWLQAGLAQFDTEMPTDSAKHLGLQGVTGAAFLSRAAFFEANNHATIF